MTNLPNRGKKGEMARLRQEGGREAVKSREGKSIYTYSRMGKGGNKDQTEGGE